MNITNKQRIAFNRHMSVEIIRRVVPLAFEAAASRFEGEHHAELIRHANIMRALPANVDPADAVDAVAAAAAAAHQAAAAYAVFVADAAASSASSAADAATAARRAVNAAAHWAVEAAADAASAASSAADAADAAAAAARWAVAAALRADAQRVREGYAACLMEAADACLPTGTIPVIPAIDSRVYQFVTAECQGLDMDDWHGDDDPENWCGTTHCRAGAAIACNGVQGFKLEKAFGPAMAGALIYAASYRAAGKPVTIPDFYAGNDEAMEELRQLAVLEGGEA